MWQSFVYFEPGGRRVEMWIIIDFTHYCLASFRDVKRSFLLYWRKKDPGKHRRSGEFVAYSYTTTQEQDHDEYACRN
jgi:hypothetical protein